MSHKKQEKQLKEIINKTHDIIEQTNDLQQALEYLLSFKNDYQNNVTYTQELGCLYYENNDLSNAQKYLEIILLDLNSAKASAILSLANIYSDQRSLELYQAGIQKTQTKINDQFSQGLNWTLSKAQLQQCLLKINLGIPQDTLVILSAIVKQDPYFLEIYYYLLLYFLNQEDQKNSLEIVQEFITQLRVLEQQNPDEIFAQDLEFYLEITDILFEGGHFDYALIILQILYSTVSKSLRVLYLIAFCQYNLSYKEQLIETFEEIDEFLKDNQEHEQELIEAIEELRKEIKKP